jgi:hypothetical protein
MTETNKQNFYIYIAFSSPITTEDYKTIINASTCTIVDNLDLDLNILRNNLKTLRIKKLTIFDVYDNVSDISKDNQYLGLIHNNLKIDYHNFSLNDEYRYEIMPIHLDEFFDKEFYNSFLIKNKSKDKIFLFRNISWFLLRAKFHTCFKVSLSGGSNTKKYQASPTQLRVLLFLYAMSDMNTDFINWSFHSESILDKKHTRSIFDIDNEKAIERLKNKSDKKLNSNQPKESSNTSNSPFNNSIKKREYHTSTKKLPKNKEVIINEIKSLYPNTHIKDLFPEKENIYDLEIQTLTEFKNYLYNNPNVDTKIINYKSFLREKNLNLLFINKNIKEKYYNIFLNLNYEDKEKFLVILKELLDLGVEFKILLPEDINTISIIIFKKYLRYIDDNKNLIIPYYYFKILKNNNKYFNNPKNYSRIENNKVNTLYQKREFHIYNINKPLYLKNYTTLVNSEKIKPDLTQNMKQFLDHIKEIINNPEYSPEQAQDLIENSWINIIKKDLENNKNLLNKHSQKLHYLIFESSEILNIYYKNKILKRKFPLLYEDLNNIEYLLIAFSFGVSLYNRLNYTNIVKGIGENILFNIYKKRRKSFDRKNKESNINFPSFKLWTQNEFKNMDINEENIKLGDFFLSMLSSYPIIIFERTITRSKGSKKFDNATLKINDDYINEIRNNLIVHPNTLPMVCKPNEWSYNSYGGFLTNIDLNDDIITGVAHKHKMENRYSLYNAINYLNSIKFCINDSLLNFLNNEGNYLITEVESDDELQRDITLRLANIYLNISFYLNCKADWRGRLYTESFFIDYQGSDLSSSLVNFYEGEPIDNNGKYYLYIHGANNHNENNISKSSFDNRINWVKDNYKKIINLDKELILKAENKYTFAAFCLNMKEIHNNPNAIIKSPVVLDATCNGIQHLAAILQDLELGTKVNLVPNEYPKDIYSELLEPINEAINKYGEDNDKYYPLSLIKLNRKIIKQSIMTKVYNVTTYGIKEQIKSKLDPLETDSIEVPKLIENMNDQIKNTLKKEEDFFICPGKGGMPVYLTEPDIFKISQIINDQIFVLFPSLNKIYNYLIDITKLMIKLEIPLTWITPSGLKITQHYVKRKKKTTIAITFGGRTKKIVLKQWTNILQGSKQTQAIIPNIIHSLDASHLINLINSNIKENFYPIITIHDCFGTLPNKMVQLEFKVKKEFIVLYTKENFLKIFHKRIMQSLRDNNITIIKHNNKNYVQFSAYEEENLIEIPKAPKLGKLDLNNIINSKYMIN